VSTTCHRTNISQLNLPHGTNNSGEKTEKLKSKKQMCSEIRQDENAVIVTVKRSDHKITLQVIDSKNYYQSI